MYRDARGRLVEGGELGRTKSKVRIDIFTEKVFLWGVGRGERPPQLSFLYPCL